MNRHLISIFYLLILTEIKQMNMVSQYGPPDKNISVSTQFDGQNMTDEWLTVVSNVTVLESSTGSSTPKNTRKGNIFDMLSDTQWLIVLAVVITIVAVVPFLYCCKLLFDCLCQRKKTESSTKDTTESTGEKFSSVQTINSQTGKPIRGNILPDNRSETAFRPNPDEMQSYEEVVKKFKDIK